MASCSGLTPIVQVSTNPGELHTPLNIIGASPPDTSQAARGPWVGYRRQHPPLVSSGWANSELFVGGLTRSDPLTSQGGTRKGNGARIPPRARAFWSRDGGFRTGVGEPHLSAGVRRAGAWGLTLRCAIPAPSRQSHQDGAMQGLTPRTGPAKKAVSARGNRSWCQQEV